MVATFLHDLLLWTSGADSVGHAVGVLACFAALAVYPRIPHAKADWVTAVVLHALALSFCVFVLHCGPQALLLAMASVAAWAPQSETEQGCHA